MRDEVTYIKLYRKIRTNKLLSKDKDAFVMFINILLDCDYETGILMTGRKKMSQINQVTERAVYSKLNLLKKYGLITVKSTTHYTEISVCNWKKYQEKSGKPSVNQVKTKKEKVVNQPELLDDSEVVNQDESSGKPVVNNRTLYNNKELRNIDIDKSISSTKSTDVEEKNWKYDENDRRLAELLFNLIKQNGHFPDKDLQDKNIDTIRLMRTSDKRKPEEIEYVINWSQQDSFWSGVILSTEGLRRNFNKMATQILRNNKSNRIVEI